MTLRKATLERLEVGQRYEVQKHSCRIKHFNQIIRELQIKIVEFKNTFEKSRSQNSGSTMSARDAVLQNAVELQQIKKLAKDTLSIKKSLSDIHLHREKSFGELNNAKAKLEIVCQHIKTGEMRERQANLNIEEEELVESAGAQVNPNESGFHLCSHLPEELSGEVQSITPYQDLPFTNDDCLLQIEATLKHAGIYQLALVQEGKGVSVDLTGQGLKEKHHAAMQRRALTRQLNKSIKNISFSLEGEK